MVLCVTGPMAAGKNSVTACLEEMGFVSIDADIAGHRAVEECTEEILAAFGELAASRGITLCGEDGKLVRRNLGALIFGNAELVRKQEEIVFPKICENIREFIDAAESGNVIINATVLFKTPEIMEKAAGILYVTAPKAVRFLRAKRRDCMKASHILSRFRSQKDLLRSYRATGIPLEVYCNMGKLSKKRLSQKLSALGFTGFHE